MLSSSPESLISDHHRAADNKSPSPMVSPSVMYKLLIPLLRCEVPDMKDSVVHALGKVLLLLFFKYISFQFSWVFFQKIRPYQSQCHHGYDVGIGWLYSRSY